MRDDLTRKRLAIAPHFTVHREASDRYLLFAETRSLRLRGAAYEQLLPLLNGALTGAEIVERLPGPDVSAALERLFEKGQVVALSPGRDVSRQAFWSARGLDPAATEDRLRQFRVAVEPLGAMEGTGTAGAAALLADLMGAGLSPCDAERADLTVVLVDDYLDPAVTRFAATLGGDRRWVPVKPGGEQPLIGPVMGGETGGCPVCLTRRLAEHRFNDRLVGRSAGSLRPARAWLAASLALARATAALEIARLALGEETAILGSVLRLDAWSGQRQAHRHWRYLDCRSCGRGAHEGDAAVTVAPVVLGGSITVDAEIGGWRTLTQEQALERLEPLVSDITGIISDIQPASGLADGLFVYNAVQVAQSSVDHMQNRRIGQPGSAGGKGSTSAQARVSCLAEAVERYSCGWSGGEPRKLGRLADFDGAAWHPHCLLNFSDTQYDNREALNKDSGPLHFVPERFNEAAEVEWTPVWSLTHEAVRWIPTRYCYFDYKASDVPGDHAFCLSDSNGCASGATLPEAILQGMLELVERDAVAIWWYNRLSRPSIALEGINDAFVEPMTERYAAMNRTVHLLDLTVDNGIPAVVAVSVMKDTGGRILMGFGAHLEPRIAAERALTELNQSILFDGLAGATAREELGTGLDAWLDSATLDTQPYLAPAPGPARRASDLPQTREPSIEAAISRACARFAELGLEMMVLDYGRSDMPLTTVRVIVPGMRHFWGRRGPGRLYDVPVALGWLASPHGEAELNPINFVL